MEQRSIAELAAAFDRDGYVMMPGIISPEELTILQADTGEIVHDGWQGKEPQSDYFHDVLADTGEDAFHRVQYVFPKAKRDSLLILLGHPFILELTRYILGDDFVCAAEALVFKMAGNGREVPVHADCDPADPLLSPVIFNVDYYLDDSSEENGCVYVAPGTHKLNLAPRDISAGGFDFPGLIPVPAIAGDVLLHNVRLVHGSRRSQGGAMRRTLYYEMQSMAEMLQQGGPRPGFPMTDAFIRDRFRLILGAIKARQSVPYAQNETPFAYRIPPEYAQKYAIERPASPDEINRRPALGYNKYI